MKTYKSATSQNLYDVSILRSAIISKSNI